MTTLPMTSQKGAITVLAKSVYGVQQFYPVCDQAKTLAALAGTKTLTAQAIGLIRNLGFEIKVTHPEAVV